MNVLITRFPYISQFGWEELHTIKLFEYLQNHHQVNPIFLGSCPVFLEAFEKRGWPAYQLNAGKMTVTPGHLIKNGLLFPWYRMRMLRKIQHIETKHGQIEAAYMHSYNEKCWLGRWIQKLPKACVWVEHQELSRPWFRKNPFSYWYKQNSKHAQVVAVGKENQSVLQTLDIPLHHIPHGVSQTVMDMHPKSPQDNIQALEKPAISFFSAGRLITDKGFMVLKNFIQDIQNKYPGSTLTIYGDGPLALELDECPHIYRYPFTDETKFYKATQKADIVLAAAQRYETYGLVILEALALGIPLICTPHYGILSEFTNSRPCISQDESNDALKKALHTIMQNKESYAHTTQKLSHYVRTHFTYHDMAQAYYSLLCTR